MATIKLITKPDIDWSSFIGTCEEYLGRSPTKVLDIKHLELNYPGFIMSMSEFQGVNDIPECGYLSEHLHFGFLVGPVPFIVWHDILKTRNLTISSTPVNSYGCMLYLSGNLNEWKQMYETLRGSMIENETDVVLGCLVQEFQKLNLGHIVKWRDDVLHHHRRIQ